MEESRRDRLRRTAVVLAMVALAVQGVWLALLSLSAASALESHVGALVLFAVAPLIAMLFWLAAGLQATFSRAAALMALFLEALVVVGVIANAGDGQAGLAVSAGLSAAAPVAFLIVPARR